MKILSAKERRAHLERMRQKMKNRGKGGFKRDQFEFRVPKTKDGDEINLYLRILPELAKGEQCEGGTATRDYDFFFYEHGAHWINNRKYECPRVHDGDECPICKLAFELLNETSDDDARRDIIKKYLPRSYFAINVYFLDVAKNPEDLRGKVMWMSAPKTIQDMFEKCLNSDDPGDDDDPKAYGFFYDVLEGYTFKLVATNKGGWNNYETSKFLPKTLGPLAVDENGEADEKAIKEILNQRHDLITKFPDRDPEKLRKLVKELVGDADDEWDSDESDQESEPKAESKKVEDDDEIVEEKPKTKSKTKSKPKKAKKDPDPDPDPEPEVMEEEEDEDLNSLIAEIDEDD